VEHLRERLGSLNPVALRLSPKTWSNLRSNTLAAVEVAGVKVLRTAKLARTPSWSDLLSGLEPRYRHGLSRFAAFCSANNTEPPHVDDLILSAFGDTVRASSLARTADALERDVARLWNRLVDQRLGSGLSKVTLPAPARPRTRIELASLPQTFRQDLEAHLT
jgi:hypothetical protein